MIRKLPLFIALLLLSGCFGATNLPVVDAPNRVQVEDVPPDGVITLRAGDTIYTVANRYRVTPRRIILANALPPPYDLSTYRELNIPKPRTHRVAKGDTVIRISNRYNVRKEDLIRLNALNEPYVIHPGMHLAIPRRVNYSVIDDAIKPVAPTVLKPKPKPPTGQAAAPSAPGRTVRFVAGAGDFTWPLDGQIIQAYGSAQRGVHNDGVNIAAEQGAVVRAARGGNVAFIGSGLKSFGNLVLIKHEGGWITAYAHLGDVAVSEGQKIQQGAVIGYVGATGRVDSPQLHFEIRQARKSVNPEDYLS